MRIWKLGLVAAAVALAACSKGKREVAADAYENAACACKNRRCAADAWKRYESDAGGDVADGWLARRAVGSAEERAEACVAKLPKNVHPTERCGGEPGEACPEGYECTFMQFDVDDGQGLCEKLE